MTTADAAARDAVREDLGGTLFLEAGAGSGKTTCLVERFVALVQDGVPADRIAAVTFTEKAAGELADRVRQALERSGDQAALDLLDRAAIGTLHAFAQRILNEHPIEAGLPPRLEVLDEISSQLAFEDRWDAFVDHLLEDDAVEVPFRMLLASGIDLRHLRDVALAFTDNWDLVAERLADRTPMAPLDLDELLDELARVVAMGGSCSEPDDKLLARLEVLAEWGARLRASADDDSRLAMLARPLRPSTKVGNTGRKESWARGDVVGVRAAVAALGERCDVIRREVQQVAIGHMADAIGRFTVAGAEERRRAGRLEFHDLLVMARAVLRDPDHGAAVRAAVRDRYQRLLLDEFQDTDPIQVELATLLAVDPAKEPGDWRDATVEPGRLFFVGDPKQSIYRFRRADIEVFLAARDRLAGSVHRLTTNFRTTVPVVDWVNQVFERLIVSEPGSQPAYEVLDADRMEAAPVGPSVTMVGNAAHPAAMSADELRRAEAADAAEMARRAVAEGWSVAKDKGTGWRPARWSDVAILLPARTSLRQLEQALESAGVPYRAETSSLVYGTGEVRDLLMVARAVEDPTDSLAAVAALRTPAFGCGDDDLYAWRVHHRGWWDHQGPMPAGAPADHPVAAGLAWLGALHRERLWLSPSQVLERIVRDRRLLEVAFVHPRPRDLWRRLRFVVDQARAWEEAGGVTLRQYLQWVKLLGAEGSRVLETVLPETDDEAVRILTVHGAKGLEFPVTILSGLTTELRARPAGVRVRFPAGRDWALKLGSDVRTEEFEAGEALDEQMDRHERLRLLYVAATRARDHLVVSVHRKEASSTGRILDTGAQVFWNAGHDAPGVVIDPPSGGASAFFDDAVAPDPLPTLVPWEAWEPERASALRAAGRPQATSATTLSKLAAAALVSDPGLAKDGRDVDLPPWQKGRYGTAIGRAVHGVLQGVDLATGDGLDAAAAAQAAAEGVPGRERVIVSLARSALVSDIVRRAAARPHWREVYVGCPLGDGVLEGFVDLLYRDDDGLVVVDHKTDAWREEADLDAKVDRYKVQLAAYAHAVGQVVGEPVARAVLLFLGPADAVEREVDVSTVDIPALREEIVALASRPTKAEAVEMIEAVLGAAGGHVPTTASVLDDLAAERR
ncbi:MAG: UvrD-helicase domain-containing protein [Acidimicrobiales bacterium]